MKTFPTELPRTLEMIEQGISAGWHIGAQIYVSLDGHVIVDQALGEAKRGTPMTPSTIMLWFSSGKPLTAVAIAQLWEQGKLALDDPVQRYIPEFGNQGKEVITLRHLLTHTAGFLRTWPWQDYYDLPWDQVIARICAASLEDLWVPGKRAGYHPASAWFLLAEMIRRLDGRPYERYIREALFLPLEMEHCWIGMPPDQFQAIHQQFGIMYDTSGEIPHPYPPPLFDTQKSYARCNPGERARGPIRELACLYEMLLARGERNGKRFLLPQTVEALTASHRVNMRDETFGGVVNWGLGVAVNTASRSRSETFRYFDEHCSPRTFGHGGYHSSLGFADPEYGLVVTVLLNGTRPSSRFGAITASIYEELGLISGE